MTELYPTEAGGQVLLFINEKRPLIRIVFRRGRRDRARTYGPYYLLNGGTDVKKTALTRELFMNMVGAIGLEPTDLTDVNRAL